MKIAAAIVAALAVVGTAGVAAHGAAPPLPASAANVVVVTTTTDVANGNTASLTALKAHPGRDGISLREALTAADKTGGSQTVYIMFAARLNSKTIELRTPLPPIHRNHLVLEGVSPNGSPAMVTLDGRQIRSPSHYGLLVVEASEVTVRWLRFTGVNPASWAAALLVGPGWESAPGSVTGPKNIANIQIEDNTFDERELTFPVGGPQANGLIVCPGPNLNGTPTHISNVMIVGNTVLHYTGNADAVAVSRPHGATNSNVTIEGNTFDENQYSIEGGGVRMIGNTITTTIRGALGISAGVGLKDTVINGTLIEGNTIAAVNGVGIMINIASPSGGDAILNTQIVNDIIRANPNGTGIYINAGEYTAASPSRVSGVEIENDTFVSEGNANLLNLLPGANGNQITGVVVRNTIMWDPNGTPIATGLEPEYQQAPNVVANLLISGGAWAGTNGNINANPNFANELGGDYHLTAGSPAINAGTTSGAPIYDIAGAARDAQPDIGAFEFGAIPRPLLTVTAEALGGNGVVTSSPAGISCGTTCNARFNPGTPVVLTAKPDLGARFLGWSGGCSGKARCVLTLTSALGATARFAPGKAS